MELCDFSNDSNALSIQLSRNFDIIIMGEYWCRIKVSVLYKYIQVKKKRYQNLVTLSHESHFS